MKTPKSTAHRRWLYPALLLALGALAFARQDALLGDLHPASVVGVFEAHGWQERAVAHPIFVLLFLLGLIHAVEATQKVTLSLLRDVRRAIARIVASGRAHDRELREILRILRRQTK
jgi:hypothetical protein